MGSKTVTGLALERFDQPGGLKGSGECGKWPALTAVSTIRGHVLALAAPGTACKKAGQQNQVTRDRHTASDGEQWLKSGRILLRHLVTYLYKKTICTGYAHFAISRPADLQQSFAGRHRGPPSVPVGARQVRQVRARVDAQPP